MRKAVLTSPYPVAIRAPYAGALYVRRNTAPGIDAASSPAHRRSETPRQKAIGAIASTLVGRIRTATENAKPAGSDHAECRRAPHANRIASVVHTSAGRSLIRVTEKNRY